MAEPQAKGHWLELEGRRVFYRTLAAGPTSTARLPLLMIHGISCCTQTWEPFLGVLGKRGDAPPLIVPDLPAHGRSARPPRLLGMADYAMWVEQLLSRLEVDTVDVMGHSTGCQVALALAHLRPERIRSLVLLGPTTGGRYVSTLGNFAGLLADSPPHYLNCSRKAKRARDSSLESVSSRRIVSSAFTARASNG